MKIYNKVIINMNSGEILEEDSYEYQGILTECKGGGGGSSKSVTNTYDPAYNARMATIAEQEQKIADEYFKFWQDTYKPYEALQIKANTSLLPKQTDLQLAQLDTEQALVPGQKKLAMSMLDEQNRLAGLQPGWNDKIMQAADINVKDKVAQAGAEVTQQFGVAKGQTLRELARQGIQAGSGQAVNAIADLASEQAKMGAAGKTLAQFKAEDEKLSRLINAKVAVGTPNPVAYAQGNQGNMA